jgi:hypothetical protein
MSERRINHPLRLTVRLCYQLLAKWMFRALTGEAFEDLGPPELGLLFKMRNFGLQPLNSVVGPRKAGP